MSELKPCPCGQIPKTLCLSRGETYKWGYVNAGCCGEWTIEFRTSGHDIDSPECMEEAIKYWNDAPRPDKVAELIGEVEKMRKETINGVSFGLYIPSYNAAIDDVLTLLRGC